MKTISLTIILLLLLLCIRCSNQKYLNNKEVISDISNKTFMLSKNDLKINLSDDKTKPCVYNYMSIFLYPKEIILDSINSDFYFFCEMKNNTGKKIKICNMFFCLYGIQNEQTSYSYPYCTVYKDNLPSFLNLFLNCKDAYWVKNGESHIGKWELNLARICWEQGLKKNGKYKIFLTYSDFDHPETIYSDSINIKVNSY